MLDEGMRIKFLAAEDENKRKKDLRNTSQTQLLWSAFDLVAIEGLLLAVSLSPP